MKSKTVVLSMELNGMCVKIIQDVKYHKVEDNKTNELNNVYFLKGSDALEAFNKRIEIIQ